LGILDQAEMFSKGVREFKYGGEQVPFDGGSVIFSNLDEADAGLRLLKEKAGPRKQTFMNVVDANRYHIGYYDKSGALKFYSKADIRSGIGAPPAGPRPRRLAGRKR
jgi:hypothetical protein